MENQEEFIKEVRDSYIPHEKTKLDELKELDRKVNLFPSVLAYTLGIVAALILGVGMCLAMQVIGVGVMPQNVLMAVGVIVGCAGIALCVANYYIYRAVLRARKAKFGDKIVKLSDELLNS